MTNVQLKKQIAKSLKCNTKDIKTPTSKKTNGDFSCTVSVARLGGALNLAKYEGPATDVSDARNKALILAVTASQTPAKKKEKKVGEPCHCGCGEMTNYKRLFRQGHDARFHGRVNKLLEGVLTMTELKKLVKPYAIKFYEAEI